MKHRLVGAAVLVALGIIIWPVVFDASPVREISQRSQIPPEPVAERFVIDQPQQPVLPPAPDNAARRAEEVVPEAVAQAQPEQQQALEQTAAVPQVAQDQYGLPVQWAVQLGVFNHLEGAQVVKQRAEAAGYHAILQSVSVKGEMRHRVYVGPKLNREAADALNRDIHQKLGIKGYVTRYYP